MVSTPSIRIASRDKSHLPSSQHSILLSHCHQDFIIFIVLFETQSPPTGKFEDHPLRTPENMAHKYTPLASNDSVSSLGTAESVKRRSLLRVCFFLTLGLSLTANFGLLLARQKHQELRLPMASTPPPISPSSSWDLVWGEGES